MIKKLLICFTCIFFLFFSFAFLIAEEFHVTNGDEFQAALTVAAENDDESNFIYMSAGVYFRINEDGDHYANFRFLNEAQYTSLIITGEEGTDASDIIIDAHGSGYCLNIRNNPLYDPDEDSEIIISGITLRNGNYNVSSGLFISCVYSKIVINNCIIQDNITRNRSGGATIYGKSIYLESNNILRNTCFVDVESYVYLDGGLGGGLFIDTRIRGDGCILQNNIIAFNTAFKNDSSWTCAGGIYFDCWDNEINLINNTIYGNVGDYGGGICFGSGDQDQKVKFYNNIIYNNTSNCADRFNDVCCKYGDKKYYVYHNNYSNFDIFDITVGFQESENNIDIDPGFEVPITGDFHIPEDSPMRDAGTESIPTPPGIPEYDFEGDPRVYGTAPDIGADEYTGYMFNRFSLLRTRWLPDREILGPRIYIWDLEKYGLKALVFNEEKQEEIEIWVIQSTKDGLKYYTKNEEWSDKEESYYQGIVEKEFRVEIFEFDFKEPDLYDLYIIADKKKDGKISFNTLEFDQLTLYITDEKQK